VRRRSLSGERLGSDAQCLTVAEALRGHTLTAAASAHRENAVGSLESGKFADFVALDRDPLTASTDELATIEVEATWVGGRCVFERSRQSSLIN
jgi:predicted amidohydrolase YtcJ